MPGETAPTITFMLTEATEDSLWRVRLTPEELPQADPVQEQPAEKEALPQPSAEPASE